MHIIISSTWLIWLYFLLLNINGNHCGAKCICINVGGRRRAVDLILLMCGKFTISYFISDRVNQSTEDLPFDPYAFGPSFVLRHTYQISVFYSDPWPLFKPARGKFLSPENLNCVGLSLRFTFTLYTIPMAVLASWSVKLEGLLQWPVDKEQWPASGD